MVPVVTALLLVPSGREGLGSLHVAMQLFFLLWPPGWGLSLEASMSTGFDLQSRSCMVELQPYICSLELQPYMVLCFLFFLLWLSGRADLLSHSTRPIAR